MNTRVFLLLGLTTTLAACMGKHMEVSEPQGAVMVTDGELAVAEAPEESVQREEMTDSVRQPIDQVVASEPVKELEMDEDRSWEDDAEAEPSVLAAPPASVLAGGALVYDLAEPARASGRSRVAPKRTQSSGSSAPALRQSAPMPSGGEARDDLSIIRRTDTTASTEEYTDYGVNGFTVVDHDALSTFSVDVDTASYTVS
ncbi:MAG: von Willebrand factor type A domain-containing protein, partial [Myxococcota bacterium]|nr:von Willebrand factor type A domain-containing protein [Myxococcota bacterium]